MSEHKEERKTDVGVPYQLFILILSILVIGILLFDVTLEKSAEVKLLLMWADYGLSILLLVDFTYQVVTATNRKKYLITWGWIDLLSCIPAFGWGRIARVIRVLKVLKTVHSARVFIDAISRRKGESALLSAVVMMIFAVIFGSVAILQCEMNEVDGNIHNASDAVWWTFCTVLKGGCENYDPVSIEGRLVAVVLMFVGMAFSATIIGLMASLLLPNNRDSI